MMTKFKRPTPQQVDAVLRSIPTIELRRVFFEKLNNPEWVKPLHKAGAFGAPPAPIVDDKGLIREEVWPEIAYLERMASHTPAGVVDVLVDLKESENSWIRRGVFSIASKVPAEQAARLVPVVDAWKYNLGFRTDPRDLAAMTTNVLNGGQRQVGIKFANILFRPRVDRRQKGGVTSGLEDYWYGQELTAVVKALGDDALPLLLSWLEKHERISGHLGTKSDLTDMSRPNIAGRDTIASDAKNALIDNVRDVAGVSFETQPKMVVDALLGSSMMLTRKIALFIAERALRGAGAEASQDMLEAGLILLRDPLSADRACRIEYADLYLTMRALGVEVGSVLSTVISNGPYGARNKLIERLRRNDEELAEVEERASAFTAAWRQSLLATIGRDSLPDDLCAVLDQLDEAEGVIESPREPDFVVRSWSGPKSPVGQDELEAMNPKELVTLLGTWTSGDTWMAPTHEGLSRDLDALLTKNPRALSGEGAAILTLRPTYIRAVLSGWNHALRDGADIDVPEALEVVRAVLEHPDESDIEPEGRAFDDDKDFVPAKQEASSLLSELLSKAPERGEFAETTRTAVDILLASLEDEAAWGRYAGESYEGMDPLTLSLNSRWPMNVDSLIGLLSFGENAPWFSMAGTALERELARDDARGASYAVLGKGVARLFNGARRWLDAHLDQFFGSAKGLSRAQQIALTTALATHRVHPDLLEILRGPIEAAIKLGGGIEMGWRGNHSGPELLGTWIVNCLIWGDIAQDDPLVQTYFSDAMPADRGAVLGQVGFGFMHAEKIDDEFRDRFGRLWDARMDHVREHPEDREELKDFYWLVRSEKFPVSWWLPRLIEAKRLDATLTTHGMVGEQLASAAQVMPAEALEALELLMDHDDDEGASDYDFIEHSLGPVIAAALRTNEPGLRTKARKFMNKLGRRGIIDIEQRVRDAESQVD